MISGRQRKGVLVGIVWGFIAWIPFYTEYLSGVRGYIGIPATLGLNLELVLNYGDAFIYSLLLGAGMGFFMASLVDLYASSVKIIGLFPSKKKNFLRRGQ